MYAPYVEFATDSRTFIRQLCRTNISGRYVLEIAACLVALAVISALPVMNGFDHWVQEFFYNLHCWPAGHASRGFAV